MKLKTNFFNYIFLLVSVSFVISCADIDEDEKQYIDIRGKVVNQLTNAPLSNIMFTLATTREHASEDSFWNWDEFIDMQEVTTDEDGFFSKRIAYTETDNSLVFYKKNEAVFSKFIEGDTDKTIADIDTSNPFVLGVRTWEELQINVKSLTPYNENDILRVYVTQTNTPKDICEVTDIVNNGIPNKSCATPNCTLLLMEWHGDNVDSKIKVNIQKGTSYRVKCVVTKNGETAEYLSEEYETISGEVNEYNLEY